IYVEIYIFFSYTTFSKIAAVVLLGQRWQNVHRKCRSLESTRISTCNAHVSMGLRYDIVFIMQTKV
ncbi:hypothetical protein, partial [Bifidobacterium aquikefiri]|uniref:hypothetical protein n=1 Tax=Bifidobacterium aquikefiri TaxID=1653207 RepID=UPI0039E94A19